MAKFEKTTWRLLITLPASGAWNMAVDEAILEGVIAGQSPPTLRLYDWAPPCLSLGYTQPIADVDMKALAVRGWDVVRRVTGGRAILHTDELTYSVIASDTDPRLAGGILTSYQRLSGALMAALEILAVPAVHTHYEKDSHTTTNQQPVCFEVPGRYEITIDGKKLVGSAQARRKQSVLQHGTLPLHGDLTRITQVLNFEDEAERAETAERLPTLATTVESALGRVVSWQEAADGFVAGFAQTLALAFAESGLTAIESELASDLVETKYGADGWQNRR